MVKSKKPKSVSVTLEKAHEDPSPGLKTHVPPEILASIKPLDQIEEDILAEEHEMVKQANRDELKNRLLFYGGVFAAAFSLFLVFKFFKLKPNDRYVTELINGATQLPL